MLPPLAPFTSLLNRGNSQNAISDHANAPSTNNSKGIGGLVGRGQKT